MFIIKLKAMWVGHTALSLVSVVGDSGAANGSYADIVSHVVDLSIAVVSTVCAVVGADNVGSESVAAGSVM